MSSEDETTMDVKGLDELVRAMKVDAPVARVGILGNHNGRSTGGSEAPRKDIPTNAEIGAFHEYGKGNNPERSFLRMPLTKFLEKRMEANGLFEGDFIKSVMKSGTLVPLMKLVGAVGKKVVLEAFATGGMGEWTPSNFTKKKNDQTLVETQQLRDSIDFDVKTGT